MGRFLTQLREGFNEYQKTGEQSKHNAFLFFDVDNLGCINNFPHMYPFLVVVHNLKPASSNMLDLCAKYLIRTLNYTPAPKIIVSIRLPLLFYAEHYSIRPNPSYILPSLL
jgi:hypothetical protein